MFLQITPGPIKSGNSESAPLKLFDIRRADAALCRFRTRSEGDKLQLMSHGTPVDKTFRLGCLNVKIIYG